MIILHEILLLTTLATPSFSIDTKIFLKTSVCHPKSDTKSLVDFNQTTSTLQDCLDLATSSADHQGQRCMSACWNKEALTCQCHVAPVWMPLPSNTIDSASINWPCSGPQDCSFNGVCHQGTCKCQAAWGGVRCGKLQLLPVDKKRMGFREKDPSGKHHNISTWGSPIQWDETTQKWHGWASEMINECGINAWNANSQIVHITADSPLGPFRRERVVATPFAHEPSVQRGPNGEWVMLYSAYNNVTQTHSQAKRGYNDSDTNEWTKAVCTNCSQGACLSPVGSPGCPYQRGKPQELNHPYIQMMATATSPNGPWTNHTEIPGLTAPWDWNTALTIDPKDGSAVALIRGGMVWHADHYADPTTWHAVNGGGNSNEGQLDKQSPQWSVSVEDPFVWRDPHNQGAYHAIAHCFSPFYGVHAFARVPDGFDFHTELMNWTVTGVAYGNTVEFTDGTRYSFDRRERPQLVFGKDGLTPVALSNGVAFGKNSYTTGTDMTFTLVQAVLKQQDEDVDTWSNKGGLAAQQ